MAYKIEQPQSHDIGDDYEILDKILQVGERFGRQLMHRRPDRPVEQQSVTLSTIGGLKAKRYQNPHTFEPAVDIRLFGDSGKRIAFKLEPIDGGCRLQERPGAFILATIRQQITLRHIEVSLITGKLNVAAAGMTTERGATLHNELESYHDFASRMETGYFGNQPAAGRNV